MGAKSHSRHGRAMTTEERLSVNGRISNEKVCTGDKNMPRALDKGLEWDILDADVEEIYGDRLPALVQKARQVVGQVQNNESLFEIALQVQDLAAEMQLAGHKIDYEKNEIKKYKILY